MQNDPNPYDSGSGSPGTPGGSGPMSPGSASGSGSPRGSQHGSADSQSGTVQEVVCQTIIGLFCLDLDVQQNSCSSSTYS